MTNRVGFVSWALMLNRDGTNDNHDGCPEGDHTSFG